MDQNEILDLLRYVADPEERTSLYHQLYPDTIKLSVAENVLIFEDLKKDIFDKVAIERPHAKYWRSYGDEELLGMATGFLANALGVESLVPNKVFGVAGVSAALECLAFALFKRQDPREPKYTVIAPAPCWQGFKWCFAQRPDMNFETFKSTSQQDPFELTLADVMKAHQDINPKPKALVLTNPHNPLGINYKPELLEDIYKTVLQRTEMHIISDELYCHSQVGQPNPSFKSALALGAYKNATEAQKQRVHVVWGFAKDFGLSGFKAGFIISSSPAVHRALQGTKETQTMAWFSPFDSLKHAMLKKLLSEKRDREPYTRYIMGKYQKVLTENFNAIAGLLKDRGIRYYRDKEENANQAQFFWLDLHEFLSHVPDVHCEPAGGFIDGGPLFEEIDEQEEKLRCYIEKEAKVLLLPGQTLRSPVPGFFRMCYTAEQKGVVETAVTRMADALDKLRP